MGSGDSAKGSKGGRRRGRSRGRGGQGGGQRQGGQRQGGQRQGSKKRQPALTAGPQKGKAFSSPYEVPESGDIAPFDLFCGCHLGVLPDGTYKGVGLGEAARRFGRSQDELRESLKNCGLDGESLKNAGFDISLAKLDMQVAPEGMDRRELARGLFDELLETHPDLAAAVTRYETKAPTGNGTEPKKAKKAPAVQPEDTAEASPAAGPEKAEAVPEEEPEPALSGTAANRPATSRRIRRSPVRRGGSE